MKKIIFLILTLSAFVAEAQTNTTLTVIRRATNQVTTIPASDTLTGVVKVDTAYSSAYKTLRYIGTTNVALTFPSGAIGATGWMYLYIPSDSILAKVMSVTPVGDATADTFRIVVDRVVTMTGSKAIKSIKAKDFMYSYQNDGSNNGRANNVVVQPGESLTMTNAFIAGTGSSSTWQEPVIISAGQTDFLILERKAP